MISIITRDRSHTRQRSVGAAVWRKKRTAQRRKRKGRAEAPRARRTLRRCRRLRIFMSVAFIMEVQM